jgi:hypothetical protein
MEECTTPYSLFPLQGEWVAHGSVKNTYNRADMIAAWALIAAFIIGCFGTEFVLLRMG